MDDTTGMTRAKGLGRGKGLLLGMVGGLASAWVMTRMMGAASRLSAETEPSPEEKSADPTTKVAEVVSERLFSHHLSAREQKVAGPLVHYAYGTLLGGLYGILASRYPVLGRGLGLPFGVAAWAWGDEVLLPLLKLAPTPLRTPVKKQAVMLGMHLAYGAGVEAVRKGGGRLLSRVGRLAA